MADSTIARLQGWIERMNAGDPHARSKLISHACERLRKLARKMLGQSYARLRAFEETDDVLQSALLRLDRSLQDPKLSIRDTAHFFSVATIQIRRELVDLARHHFRPGRPRPVPLDSKSSGSVGSSRQADSTHDPAPLLDWREFHDHVAALPDTVRQVFELLWYHELTQAETAEALKVSVSTVKRLWLAARLELQEALGGARW